MSLRPRLAIVIPSRDSRELTLKCLRSLGVGSTGTLEAWVVDDASRDDSCTAIEARFPQVEVLRSDEPRGFTVSANCGLRRTLQHTQADLLLLLNSDTEIEPGSLAALIEAFDRDPRLGIAGGTLHYPDGSPQWSGGREPSLAWLFALASGLPRLLAQLPGYRRLRPLAPKAADPVPVDWVTGAALALRREVWDEVGPLDERFRFYCQDLDLCRRASRAGWGVALLPEFRVLHHHGATIEQETGAVGRQHPELLWTDLILWAAKHRGNRWARKALWTLQTGGRLRLLGRRLARFFGPRTERDPWDRDDRALHRALAALRNVSPESLPQTARQDKTTAVGNPPNSSP